jgi:hypothetical protein
MKISGFKNACAGGISYLQAICSLGHIDGCVHMHVNDIRVAEKAI